jgi:hypothetical protein
MSDYACARQNVICSPPSCYLHFTLPLSSGPQAAISLEEDGANIVSSTLADELLGAPFASMAPRSSGAHVGRCAVPLLCFRRLLYAL